MPQPVVTVPEDLPTVVAEASAPPFDPAADLLTELDRQVELVLTLGVGQVLGLAPDDVRRRVEPLRAALGRLLVDGGPPADADAVAREDHVPLVLVLDGGTAGVVETVPAMRRGARRGVSVLPRDELAGYTPLPDVEPPAGPYLLLDVDTGGDLRGVTPEDALVRVRGRGRTPLTVAEGVALVVVRPDVLRPNRCFSLPGARAGDQRVPAVWISERRPKLGWCWDRNPHTWLGTAHAATRLGG
ncbi:DUF5701 family protein [Cellulomonas carbonis]|uniref:Uncharacterized protein n=1 Tax=Cellulomonas carbonis T26 TaxID=947969 RepID=A0A0A0BLI9_9CELL|nr:DUF5701 family protein [Cellulomonas carbonis]KGM09388.1 hypothetical protein N868_02350 [Cellulomonas carbonis T26]GGC04559.1 hypothetical protein GCM10010972_17210 [Cellulomonas carbonis]